MTWAWVVVIGAAVSVAVALVGGRQVAKIADQYPLIESDETGTHRE